MNAVSNCSGTLSHLVVLDLSQWMSGPYCTQILADLGARVIKVEPPSGDPTREIPPHFVRGNSAYFHSLNRNKESIAIDLKQPRGRDLFLRLVQRAQIVVENFRPGVMERLGLDYPKLAEVNPRVILCSISGFGQNGPYRERPAFDAIVQALSGGMSITGEPGHRPVMSGIRLGDLSSGMLGAIGALAALAHCAATGHGQQVDVSMLDGQISMLSYPALYYLVSGEVPIPQGRGHVSIPTYRAFTCADDVDVLVAANTEKMWQSLCKALELPELPEDPRFLTNEDRLRHKEALWDVLQARFLRHTSDEWMERLLACNVPAAPVNTVDRALEDPQVVHRHMVAEVHHPAGDTMRLLGNPIKLSHTPGESFAWPPDLGQHTRPVLQEFLGLSVQELEALEAQDAICQAHRHTCASEGIRG